MNNRPLKETQRERIARIKKEAAENRKKVSDAGITYEKTTGCGGTEYGYEGRGFDSIGEADAFVVKYLKL